MWSAISQRRRLVHKVLVVLVMTAAAAPAAFPASGSRSGSVLRPEALARAKVIRAELNARYRRVPGRTLAVTDVTSMEAVESFTLLSAGVDEARIVPADGIWFAICPARATCPYPGRRFARPAGDLLVRRLALELAVRTFLETSVSVVAVGLPTPHFTFLVVERQEPANLPALARALRADPARAPAASLLRVVDQLTRPRVYVAIAPEPTPSGNLTLSASPYWPHASAR